MLQGNKLQGNRLQGNMVQRIISEGSKVELQRFSSLSQKKENSEVNTYYSLVSEVMGNNRIKITMPLEKGRIVLLPVNVRYNACFYTPNGLYQGRVLIVDRYRDKNVYMLVVELISDLVKFQRRQYYRLGCTMDMKYKKIEENEKEYEDLSKNNIIIDDKDFIEGTALDISGGGMRFVSRQSLAKGDSIFVILEIQYENEKKEYGLNARVVTSELLTNQTGRYEHRIEYKEMSGKVRESLIKYIFDEERRQRKK